MIVLTSNTIIDNYYPSGTPEQFYQGVNFPYAAQATSIRLFLRKFEVSPGYLDDATVSVWLCSADHNDQIGTVATESLSFFPQDTYVQYDFPIVATVSQGDAAICIETTEVDGSNFLDFGIEFGTGTYNGGYFSQYPDELSDLTFTVYGENSIPAIAGGVAQTTKDNIMAIAPLGAVYLAGILSLTIMVVMVMRWLKKSLK